MKINDYIEYLTHEKKYAQNTIKAYSNDLKEFLNFMDQHYEIKDINGINYKLIRTWLVELTNKNITNKSINRKIICLRGYYKFLQHVGFRDDNPLSAHKSLKNAKKVQVPFSELEVRLVLDEIIEVKDYKSSRDQLIIELLYTTGIRVSELMSIQIEDLDFFKKTIKIKGKGNKERYVNFFNTVEGKIKSYLKYRELSFPVNENKFLFLTEKGIKLYYMLVYRIINNYFSKASTKLKCSPHVIRHTFATHLINNGASMKSIKELLGHSSIASTQVYAHTNLNRLKETYKLSHPRNK